MAEGIKTKCDFCGALAVYDGKTKMGPWAYMCESCYAKHGVHVEGLHTRLAQAVDTGPHKVCSICHEDKPLSEFYGYLDHTGTQRYRSECIKCNLARRRAHK